MRSDDPSERNFEKRQLRQFGICLACVIVGLAWWKEWSSLVTILSWGSAVVLLGVAAVCPMVLRIPFQLSMFLAAPIGWVIGEVVMLGLFGLVFLPLGWILRGLGRDSLQQRLPETSSLWHRRSPRSSKSSYFRRF